MQRLLPIACVWLSVSCQLPSEQPPASPEPQPGATSDEPAPLPPEETPPPEAPEPPPAAEAKPIEPGITSTGAPTRGTLPKGVVDEKLKSASRGINACYELGLKAVPDLRGNVSVNFVVAPDGKVAHAEALEVEDPLTHPDTIQCILGVIKKLEFPEPKGGRVFLNYPIKLEPTKPPTP